VNATLMSLPSLQSTRGWEMNGAVGNIAFADSSGGRFQIDEAKSNAGRIGKRITGVNTDLDGRPVGTNGAKGYLVGAQGCFLFPCGSRP
jgi:hypothetical protein